MRLTLALEEGLGTRGHGKRKRTMQPQNSLAYRRRKIATSYRSRIAVAMPRGSPIRRSVKSSKSQRSIREIVFGAQDGVLTTLGIATGVGSATAAPRNRCC